MNSRQVPLQIAFMHKLPATNLAFVNGLRMISCRSMSRVVVSVDRCLVSEHHVTDLTLDTRHWRPDLKTHKTYISKQLQYFQTYN